MIHFATKVLQKILNGLRRLESRDRGNAGAIGHRREVIRSTKLHDMVALPDEAYYGNQYWYWISKYLESERLPKDGVYADLGCGQGRLTIRLSEWASSGGTVSGSDISDHAIREARDYTEEKGLQNVTYEVADATDFLKSRAPDSLDGIMFLEVAFFMPGYEEVLKEAKRVLAPGGLLFASFRPQYFNMLYAVSNGRWEDLSTIVSSRSGTLWESDARFTWQTSDEIKKLFKQDLGFELLELVGVGCLSGIEGDPHADIARPSELDEAEREKLMQFEIELARSMPDAGRYMLAIARK